MSPMDPRNPLSPISPLNPLNWPDSGSSGQQVAEHMAKSEVIGIFVVALAVGLVGATLVVYALYRSENRKRK